MTEAQTGGPVEQAAVGARVERPRGKSVRLTSQEYETLQQQARQAVEAREQMLRLAAELENARRRMEKDRETYIRLASEEMVRRLLPILDDLTRATSNAIVVGVDLVFRNGLQMIRNHLWDALKAAGLEPIVTVGERFDPHRHEAVTQVESSEHPDHTVIEEIRSGFLLNGHLIRPAMVKVAIRPAVEQETQDTGHRTQDT